MKVLKMQRVKRGLMFSHFDQVHKFWKKNKIYKTGRAAFFKLQPDGKVMRHIDEGTYYHTKDRYHLSLQSRYHYTVGDEEMIVEPGTFFWFNLINYHMCSQYRRC